MKYTVIALCLCLPPAFTGCRAALQPVEQRSVERIDMMPDAPSDYVMIDWHVLARQFDSLAFDPGQTGRFWPLIWTDDSRRNFDQPTFGLYTAIGDVRQGPGRNGGEFHESLCTLGAVLGGTLVGVDKNDQYGRNFVGMLRNYFNSDNGWNIVMNNTTPEVGHLGGGYGWDFWYDIYPNLLFYSIGDRYPDEPGYEQIMHSVAEQFCKADSVITGNYSIQYFDFGKMAPGTDTKFKQEDAAAGFSWILYMAWRKFGDERYLRAAQNAMNALQTQQESRFWEILMPYGAYVAARMNAEQGTSYDVFTLIDWTFSGKSTNRYGWGVISGGDGQIALDGLCGSVTEARGYGFLMNTFELASPLVPLVRYDQSLARAVGKWMLNAACNARYCYPDHISPSRQLLYDKREATKGVIAYEGVRMANKYGEEYLAFNDVGAVALGDGPGWAEGNPPESMFSIYGSAHVGIFGSIIRTTDVEKVLQLDCLATDFFRGNAYPTYLYYNPYFHQVTVNAQLSDAPFDLYDIVSHTWLAQKCEGMARFTLPASSAAVAVVLPAGSKLYTGGGKTTVNNIIIDYNAQRSR